MQEIIVAVMEAGGDEDGGKRVMFVEENQLVSALPSSMNTGAKSLNPIEEEEEKTAATVEEEKHEPSEAEQEAERLKANWTKQFLEHHGWDYIFNSFMAK